MNKRGDRIPGRFDTALINDGTGEETGIEGVYTVYCVLFQGVQLALDFALKGTVLVVSVSSFRFHQHPFQSFSMSMLWFLSI